MKRKEITRLIKPETLYETIQTHQFKFDHGVDSVVQEILMSISFRCIKTSG